MRRVPAILVLAMLSLAPASAQQLPQGGLPTPRITPLQLPNYFGPVSATTSNCLGASGGVAVSVTAEATLPAGAADERVPFQILEGNVVRASGEAEVLRVRLPTGPAARPRVVVRASFDRSGQIGEGQVRIRIGGSTPSESASASYSWTCAAYRPSLPSAPTLPAPDLAFDTRILTVQMTRDRRDPAEERYARGGLNLFSDTLDVQPNGRVQLWDRTMCRGFDSAWAVIRFEFTITNRGAAEAPTTFEVEGRVPDAPAWPNDRAVRWPHSRTTTQLLDLLPAARAATGRQSTIHFQELESRYWLVRDRPTVYNRFEVVIPCGRDRRIEVILDPNNRIVESDETNNTLVLHYDLLG